MVLGRRLRYITLGRMLFPAVNGTILLAMAVVTLYPFLYVVSVSMSSYRAFMLHPIMAIPREITFAAYAKIFGYPTVWRSYGVTVWVTVVGTIVDMTVTILMAYPLSKSRLRGTGTILVAVIFVMVFHPALIPKFLVAKQLGLIDSLWALVLPTAVSPFNLILMKNFFQSVPASLEESALIDGASYTRILTRIIVPVSMHAVATIGLFYAVEHWNNYFSAVVYIRSMTKWPLQLLLREVVMQNNMDAVMGGAAVGDLDMVSVVPLTVQMATVVAATIPILCVYPFIQKYFTKGVMLGSIKE